MSPQNNIERRAARALASHEGTKYTEALRKVRSSRMNPSDILRDPASVGNSGPSRESENKRISDYLKSHYRPGANEANLDLVAANDPEMTLSRYRDGALQEVAREVDAHRKHVATHTEDSHCGWSTLTAVMEGRPDTYLWLMKTLDPVGDPANTVGILEGMTLDPRITYTFEQAVKEKRYLVGLTGIFKLIRGLQMAVPGEDRAETSRLLHYAPLTESLRPRPALASSALTFFLLTIPEEEMAEAIIESVIDRRSDDMAELVIALGWYEARYAQEFAEEAEFHARSSMALCT